MTENSEHTPSPDFDVAKVAEVVLGYLNFSNGSPDGGFQGGLNQLFGLANSEQLLDRQQLKQWFLDQLAQVAEANSAFQDDRPGESRH